MASVPDKTEPGSSTPAAQSRQRDIFRAEALQHYRRTQDRIVFPRFTTPRALAYLWVLVIVLILVGVAVVSQAFLALG